MRLIDADSLYRAGLDEYISEYGGDEHHFDETRFSKLIQSEPTATVERDIPKAPTGQQLEEDGYGAWGSLYGDCPNCKGTVYDEQNYCEKCGQRLDWNGDPNGFNDETVQALKDTTERKNLSKVYETLDDMYAAMDVSEWHEYIYRERETEDGIDSDRMAELLRCKDCRRWNTKDGMFKDFDERQWHECPYLGVPTDEWFFCRDAERKDDER